MLVDIRLQCGRVERDSCHSILKVCKKALPDLEKNGKERKTAILEFFGFLFSFGVVYPCVGFEFSKYEVSEQNP